MHNRLTDAERQARAAAIKALMVGEGLMLTDIATRLGFSLNTVKRAMRAVGLRPRRCRAAVSEETPFAAARLKAAIEMYTVKRLSCKRIAKALGVSFPTVTRALRVAGVMPPPIPRPGVRKRLPPPERKALYDEAERLYRQAGLTLRHIGRQLGVNQSCISFEFSKRGIPVAPRGMMFSPDTPGGAARLARAVELYTVRGWTSRRIADVFGVHFVTILHVLRQAGVQIGTDRGRLAKAPRETSAPAKRHRWPSSEFAFIRTVGDGLVQARGFLAKTDVVNLGTFGADTYGDVDAAYRAANRAGIEFHKRMAVTPRPDPWDVIEALQRVVVNGHPVIPANVLPKRVYRLPNGAGYGGRVRGLHLPGPFPTPKAARDAMTLALAGPRPIRRKKG